MLDKIIRIIDKPWGREEILENNEKYTVKRLTMNEGCRCSYQYHERKLETVFVLEGELIITYEDGERRYNPGEFVTIKPFEKHRMSSEKGNAIYLECSTSELEDVVRINDDYGRK
jgi:mannose-6-phosphate isomerase